MSPHIAAIREELERCVVDILTGRQWEVGPECDWDSGITLPVHSDEECLARQAPTRYECNRRKGHGGRHAATGTPDMETNLRNLMAVWA